MLGTPPDMRRIRYAALLLSLRAMTLRTMQATPSSGPAEQWARDQIAKSDKPTILGE